MAQTWNNLLGFIKRNMGAKLNLLEMSDEEIIEGIQEDVIPYFSQFVPHKKGLWLSPENLITHNSGRSLHRYKLPLPNDDYVVDIFEVYSNISSNPSTSDPYYSHSGTEGALPLYGRGTTDVLGGGVIDALITNQYLDILNYMGTKNTWEFFPPNIIAFDNYITNAVVIYNTTHESLDTILPDMYHRVFKKLCLSSVQTWIMALRAKYENLSTPMGEIQINWQKLESDAEKNKNEAEEVLNNLPPDHFIHIVT